MLHADGRDEGLQDIDADSPEAFHAWLHDRDRCGGHPWEVCRGGNSTHVDLRVMEDMRGYFLYLAGAAWNRTIETVKFYLALTRADIPVYLAEAKMLVDRLAEEEKDWYRAGGCSARLLRELVSKRTHHRLHEPAQ